LARETPREPSREPPLPALKSAPSGQVWLYGTHAVAAALANPARLLRRVMLTEEAEAEVSRHYQQTGAGRLSMQIERVDRARLEQLLGRGVSHQGAALLADPLPQVSLQLALQRPGPVVVLDQVSDPRNVGAIIRSAAAFGAAAVITQDRNAPEENGAMAKAACGAMERLPLIRAVNIARTLIALRAAGLWIVGMDAVGTPLRGPAFANHRVALVLGNEGEGLRRLTRETCDEICSIAMPGGTVSLDSLNVSAAATVALYELAGRA
jgi:23S rRNA (guanosine2251-2'-O)-methyltransferase